MQRTLPANPQLLRRNPDGEGAPDQQFRPAKLSPRTTAGQGRVFTAGSAVNTLLAWEQPTEWAGLIAKFLAAVDG